MSAEFPRAELLTIADVLGARGVVGHAEIIRRGVKAYSELSERCVMDQTKHSLEVAALRLRIRQLEGKP